MLGRQNPNVHKCDLDKNDMPSCMPPLPPFSPTCRKFLRRVRLWSLASSSCRTSHVFYPSRSQMLREKIRHVTTRRFRYSVHPFSVMAVWRRRFMLLVWTFLLAYEPYVVCVNVMSTIRADYLRAERAMFSAKKVTFLLTFCDIVANFFTGYVNTEVGHVELDPTSIACHYLKTYFVFDFTATLLDFLYLMSLCPPDYVLVVKPLHFLRLVRIFTVVDHLKELLKSCNLKESAISLIVMLVVNLFILHWFTSMLFFLPKIIYDENPVPRTWNSSTNGTKSWHFTPRFWESTLLVACHFYGAFSELYVTENECERIILTLVLLTGYIQMKYFVAVGLQYFGYANFSEAKYEQFFSQVCDYMKGKKFPNELKDRIKLYYEYKFRKRFFLEHVILDTLSLNLRYEVLLYDCRNLLSKVTVFKKLPKSAIGEILPMMKHEIYLPHDYILKSTDISDNLFFVSYGTVGVYFTDQGQEACHFEDGSNFGENHMLLRLGGQTPFFDVIAVEVTEVYTVDVRLLKWIFVNNPIFKEHMDDCANRRMEFFNWTYSQSYMDRKIDLIISELRKGRILERFHTNRELNL